MHKAIVSAKGHVVIPAELRRKYGIKPGTEICFIEHGHEIILQPVTAEYFRGLVGMFKSRTSMTKALLRERALDKKREEAKFKKFKKLSGSR
ncbi:MAG: AbrB/MazE/SpoVT family DNA-binding domain-containing protein [Deltaproteobacteria bacterium]|nr:AbrB/MazE/SpoVT family DNA-binding domain-containing protein [Deltaproteobacteria bacterium]